MGDDDTWTYWFRWQSADGRVGPPMGEYATRDEAHAAMIEQVRAAAEAMEFGLGKPGWWTPDGELWSDDMFHDDAPLGRYVIEQVAPEE